MGKAIVTILTIVLLVVVGYFIFDRNDNSVVTENANATSTDLTGTGGADEGYDPLNNLNNEVAPDSKG